MGQVLEAIGKFLGAIFSAILPELIKQYKKPQESVIVGGDDVNKAVEADLISELEQAGDTSKVGTEAKEETTKVIKKLTLLFLACSFLTGCFGGFARHEVIAMPNTPVVISEIGCKQVKVFAYSKEHNKLIELGWVNLNDYKGWTIQNFDWSKYTQGKINDK